MTITAPANFSLHRTINSHGWYDLPPFSANAALTELTAVVSLSKAKHLHLRITQKDRTLHLTPLNKVRLTRTEQERVKNIVRSMLRMDEPLEEFYALCRKEPHLRWVPKKQAGRMLRSATAFEDVVKTLFTTNCSWALTKIQTENLVKKLGTPLGNGVFSFPTPDRIAGVTERWLRKELSCGYRAPYLLELCRAITKKQRDVEMLRHMPGPTQEVYDALTSMKGIGHYAAGNLLKLLGRYDHLGIDSWVRTKFAEQHRNGRKVTKDDVIERHYDRYGRWRGLVCTMEVTADWHV